MAVVKTMTRSQIEHLRSMAQEFIDLTNDGDFSDFAVVNRYSKLSAQLALAVGPLLDTIERLQAEREDGGRSRIVKFDSAGGRA
jgi:hypothetical protein